MKQSGLFLRDVFRHQFGAWLLAIVLALLASIAALGLLMVSGGFIVASALAGMVALGSQMFNYLMPSAVIRFLAMMRTAARYGELLWSHQMVLVLLKNLRISVFRALANQSVALQPEWDSARQMHRLVSDIDTLDEFPLRVLLPYFQAACLGVLLAVVMAIQLPYGLWVGLWLCGVLFVPLSGAYCVRRLAMQQMQWMEQRRRHLLYPLRLLTRLILWQRWQSSLTALLADETELQRVKNTIHVVHQALSLLVQWWLVSVWLVLLWLGGQALVQQQLEVTWLLAMVLGVLGWQEWVLQLCQNIHAYGLSRAAQQRLNALIYRQQNHSGSLKQSLPSGSLELTLNEVSARMPDALFGAEHISLTILSGQPCCITGVSGSGKTTLLHVLAQELVPISGSLKLNHQDVSDYDWTGQIGYLSQHIDIFAQTLAQNLRLGKADASDAALYEVLHKVALGDWVANLPQGLETPLGEYGVTVSGGQARRIALARLLLQPKRLLLLDEPFAGLDKDSRQIVWQTVCEAQRDGLLVVVSHQIWQEMGHHAVVFRLPEYG